MLGRPEPHKDTRSAGLRGNITVPCTFFSPIYAVAAFGQGTSQLSKPELLQLPEAKIYLGKMGINYKATEKPPNPRTE